MVGEPSELTRLVSHEQRVAIWESYLELGSFSKVAKALNRDRETVARHIKCPEFEQFQAKALEDAGKAALGRLKQYSPKAAEDWERACSVAADKGDHRPAKDLLVSTGVIQTDQLATQQGIVIVNGFDQKGEALPNPFMAFAGRSETAQNPSRQGFDNKVGQVPHEYDGCGIEPGNKGESDPNYEP